jgi:hypothetical protein
MEPAWNIEARTVRRTNERKLIADEMCFMRQQITSFFLSKVMRQL